MEKVILVSSARDPALSRHLMQVLVVAGFQAMICEAEANSLMEIRSYGVDQKMMDLGRPITDSHSKSWYRRDRKGKPARY